MRRSTSAIKTRRDDPSDEEALNAKLLIRAGFINKEMAGVYALLPAGLAVVEKIKAIVRDEMNALGGQELLMTTLQSKQLWEKTDRWDSKKVDIWFKSQLQNGTEVGMAWSHEEPISEMMKNHISSYRDLPSYVYQFQTKLRNEIRAKSGIMRGREFLMKDLYSYTTDEAAHQKFYDEITQSYLNVFERLGLGDRTFLTFASGGPFAQFSHEFQTLTETGEDTIFLDRKKKLAVNKEVMTDEILKQLSLDKSDLEEVTASEVGNIFSFGDKKSKDLELYYADKDGNQKPVILGSYGIGITRLLGVLTEIMADDKGLVWPANVAPAQVYLVHLGGDDALKQAEATYKLLQDNQVEVIFDDRDVNAGEKFGDADLMGIPWRVVVSDKTLEAGGVELKARTSDDTKIVASDKLISSL